VEVVKVLLKRDDVIPDKLDDKGRASLSVTASKARDGVVKILLARDGTPDEAKKISTVEHYSGKLLKVDTREL